MSIVIGKRLTFAFALVLLLLVVNALVSYEAVTTLIRNNEQVYRTQRVLTELEETLSAVKDAETGQRGFLITKDRQFLEPYTLALQSLDEHLRSLKDLLRENPDQLARAESLETALKERVQTLTENLNFFEQQGVGAQQQPERLLKGKGQMDTVRRRVVELKGEENRLLAIRQQETQRSARNTILTFIISNLVALVMLAGIFALLNREVKERQRAAEELKAAHDVLEVKVRERTAELIETNASLTQEITERARAEEKLRQFTVELERSNRELQDFAFVASHDLQEPLRKIQAFGDRLKTRFGEGLGKDGLDYLGRMQNAAHRMHVLINDLLMFSRVTTKGQPFAPVDLRAVTREVLSDLEVRIQQSGGSVEVGELMTIEADALQMRQLMQNLIGNSLKFHRPDAPPVVRIDSRIVERQNEHNGGSQSFCELAVADNGIGFDEKYLDRIFTPFQRLHGRNEYEGTGMGLAVCRKIVERHGGSITARSEVGVGTTFLIDLPLTQKRETVSES